jgi:hypothetical protein
MRVMPWDLSAFVGRTREREQLVGALADESEVAQLHTLYGVAGAGKTRLARVVAVDAAGGFPGGTLFAEGGPDALVAALGAPTGGDPVERVAHALGNRDRTLCVLDQAGALDPDLVTALPAWLASGAHAFVVAARTPIDLRGARRLEVAALAPADGIELLRRRMAELGAGEPPPAEVAARLVDQVEGLPLGIELCAGALALRSAESLFNSLGALESADADRPARHRSLERAAEDTWCWLDAADREALLVASVFAASFSREDFDALAAARSLDRLVARGLVARSGQESMAWPAGSTSSTRASTPAPSPACSPGSAPTRRLASTDACTPPGGRPNRPPACAGSTAGSTGRTPIKIDAAWRRAWWSSSGRPRRARPGSPSISRAPPAPRSSRPTPSRSTAAWTSVPAR